MNNQRNILIMILTVAVIILLLLRNCDNSVTSRHEPRTNTVIKHTRTIDTVYFEKSPKTIEVVIYKPDTIYQKDTTDSISNELYSYSNPYEDSLIKGNISTIINTKGGMMSQKLTYTPLFPKYIYIKDSVTIEVSQPKTNAIYFGGDIGIAPTSYIMLKPKVGVHLKNNYSFDIGYDMFNKGYHVGFTKTIRRKGR